MLLGDCPLLDIKPSYETDKTGPARLLDTIEGRSKHSFKTWLTDRPQVWRDAGEAVVVGSDGGQSSWKWCNTGSSRSDATARQRLALPPR